MQQVQRFLCSATGKDTTSRVATERGLVLHFQPHLKSLFQEHNLQELAEKFLPFSKIPGLQNPTIFQDYVSRTKDAFRKMFRHASTTPTVPPSPTTPVSAAASLSQQEQSVFSQNSQQPLSALPSNSSFSTQGLLPPLIGVEMPAMPPKDPRDSFSIELLRSLVRNILPPIHQALTTSDHFNLFQHVFYGSCKDEIHENYQESSPPQLIWKYPEESGCHNRNCLSMHRPSPQEEQRKEELIRKIIQILEALGYLINPSTGDLQNL